MKLPGFTFKSIKKIRHQGRFLLIFHIQEVFLGLLARAIYILQITLQNIYVHDKNN